MSITRLLVLGVVKILQPVHGYSIQRELGTWDVGEWANVKPGSIYSALRSLEKGGYLSEVTTQSEGNRPARTTYRITTDGETLFLKLLRQALWTTDTFNPGTLMAGLGPASAVSRLASRSRR